MGRLRLAPGSIRRQDRYAFVEVAPGAVWGERELPEAPLTIRVSENFSLAPGCSMAGVSFFRGTVPAWSPEAQSFRRPNDCNRAQRLEANYCAGSLFGGTP